MSLVFRATANLVVFFMFGCQTILSERTEQDFRLGGLQGLTESGEMKAVDSHETTSNSTTSDCCALKFADDINVKVIDLPDDGHATDTGDHKSWLVHRMGPRQLSGHLIQDQKHGCLRQMMMTYERDPEDDEEVSRGFILKKKEGRKQLVVDAWTQCHMEGWCKHHSSINCFPTCTCSYKVIDYPADKETIGRDAVVGSPVWDTTMWSAIYECDHWPSPKWWAVYAKHDNSWCKS